VTPSSSASERRARLKRTPIEDKESYRWVEGSRQAEAEAKRAPNTCFISVADSEADIYELLAEGQGESQKLDWIVRACGNRALGGGEAKDTPNTERAAAEKHVREHVMGQDVLCTQTIKIRGRKAKIACDR
jgi:hypothetical protein